MSAAPLPPAAATPHVRTRMQRVRRRDTAAEVAVRSALHRRGLRYRVDVRPIASLRRRADIVFRREKVAVFVDGCFWHGCAEHRGPPKTNTAWWQAKIERNRARDRNTDAQLFAEGWSVRCEFGSTTILKRPLCRIERLVKSRRMVNAPT